jgi:Zn-dependent protease
VFQTLVSSISSVFFCMLQLLHLNVSKVDQVLHMRCAWKTVDGADDVWDDAGALLVHSWRAQRTMHPFARWTVSRRVQVRSFYPLLFHVFQAKKNELECHELYQRRLVLSAVCLTACLSASTMVATAKSLELP